MSTEETNPLTIDEAQSFIQDAARLTATVRRRPALMKLKSPQVRSWLSDQMKDLEEGSTTFHNIKMEGVPTPEGFLTAAQNVENVVKRTKKMEKTIRRARNTEDHCNAIIKLLTQGKPLIDACKTDKSQEKPEEVIAAHTSEMMELVTGIKAELTLMQGILDDIEPDLDPEKIEKIMSSVSASGRPLKAFLAKQSEAAQQALDGAAKTDVILKAENVVQLDDARSASSSNTGPAPRPSPVSRMTPPPPSDKLSPQMRKKLGPKMSSFEIEQVSLTYFKKLWEQGIDQANIGKVLYYEPKDTGGMTVSDLLEYARGRDLLRLAFPELLARFALQA